MIKKFLFLKFFSGRMETRIKDAGWLIFRVALAALMLRHGYEKLMGFSAIAPHFPDPLHIGQQASLALTVFAEFFASITLLVGLFTRWSAILGFVTMMIAAFVVHGADPFAKKELAALYALCYLFFMCNGGGKYSLDKYIKKYF